MKGVISGVLYFIGTIYFLLCFFKSAHPDDDNPMGNEAADPSRSEL